MVINPLLLCFHLRHRKTVLHHSLEFGYNLREDEEDVDAEVRVYHVKEGRSNLEPLLRVGHKVREAEGKYTADKHHDLIEGLDGIVKVVHHGFH